MKTWRTSLGLIGSLALSCVPNQAVLAQKGVMLMNRIGPTSSTLNVANADGSNEHALLPKSGFDYHASWSAAGRWIVFTSERNGLGQADIYRVRPDGTGLERLTDSPALDDQAVLSPDGSGGVEWRAIRLRPRFMPPIPPFATRR